VNPQVEQLLALMRRYPWCVACTVVTLLCGGATWYLLTDVDDLLADQYPRAEKDYKEMLDLTKGGLTQRQELETVTAATRRIYENLVLDELADNYQYFYKFEDQAKAHLVELHQLNSPSTDTSPLFRRVPYALRVTGTYEQVASFLLALETGPRLAKITTFTISRSTAAGKDAGSRGGGGAPADGSGATAVVLDLALELLGKK
jgi:hypothetical protein